MNQSDSFEDVTLNVGTHKAQNLELLLDAADFAKFFAMEDLTHYDLYKAMGHKHMIGSGPVMAKCHFHTYSNPRGKHYFIK